MLLNIWKNEALSILQVSLEISSKDEKFTFLKIVSMKLKKTFISYIQGVYSGQAVTW